MGSTFTIPPTLQYGRSERPGVFTDDVWKLHANLPGVNDKSFTLEIRHDAVENMFTWIVTDNGTFYQAVTPAERDRRCWEVLGYENLNWDEAMEALMAGNGHSLPLMLMSGAGLDIFRQLEGYWRAICIIVSPSVTR